MDCHLILVMWQDQWTVINQCIQWISKIQLLGHFRPKLIRDIVTPVHGNEHNRYRVITVQMKYVRLVDITVNKISFLKISNLKTTSQTPIRTHLIHSIKCLHNTVEDQILINSKLFSMSVISSLNNWTNQNLWTLATSTCQPQGSRDNSKQHLRYRWVTKCLSTKETTI